MTRTTVTELRGNKIRNNKRSVGVAFDTANADLECNENQVPLCDCSVEYVESIIIQRSGSAQQTKEIKHSEYYNAKNNISMFNSKDCSGNGAFVGFSYVEPNNYTKDYSSGYIREYDSHSFHTFVYDLNANLLVNKSIGFTTLSSFVMYNTNADQLIETDILKYMSVSIPIGEALSVDFSLAFIDDIFSQAYAKNIHTLSTNVQAKW